MDYNNFELPALIKLLFKNVNRYNTMRYDGFHNGKDFRKAYTIIEDDIDDILDAIMALKMSPFRTNIL